MKQQKSKTSIWLVALSLVSVLALILGSCAKEPLGLSMSGGDFMEVRVTFAQGIAPKATSRLTEVGTGPENQLDRVTILVFNEGGTKLETVLSEDVRAANTSLIKTQPKWASDQTLVVSPVINQSKPKVIYAIANWSKSTFDKETYTEAKLKEELIPIAAVADMNGPTAYAMLMSGSKSVGNLTSIHYSVTVAMERQAAKIKALMTIKPTVRNKLPNTEWQIGMMTIRVVKVPNKSYIIARGALPAEIIMMNSTAIEVNDTRPAVADQDVPATKDLTWSESIYINENPMIGKAQAQKDSATYIVVQLPYKNRTTGILEKDNYYKLLVNDKDAASPYKVLRNTIYNFNINIIGLGLPFNDLTANVNIEDQLTVNSWENGEFIDGDNTLNYFNISRGSIAFKRSETSRQCTIDTDVANWKLMKNDGTILFSYAEGTTAPVTVGSITYTLGGTVTKATITVSKPESVEIFPKQNMFFIAKNLKVPFTVDYDISVVQNL